MSEVPARVLAFDAIVEIAVEKAGDDTTGYYYRGDIETSEVVKRVDDEVSERSVYRAFKDAAELGWVTDERSGWDVGDRAQAVAGVEPAE